MLMRRVTVSAMTLALLAAGLLLQLAAAQVSVSSGKTVNERCDNRGNCQTIITESGGSGGGGSSSGGDGKPVSGTKPGATSCSLEGKKIPCKTDVGHWQPGAQCYIELDDPQEAAPAGQAKTDGAWYTCWGASISTDLGCLTGSPVAQLEDGLELCGNRTAAGEWRDSPPPGVNQLTPAQAAQRLVDSFQLQGPDFTTSIAKPESGAVGLPVWLWVPEKNQKALNWGPYKRTATLGGVTITAVAQVSSVAYDMGDGSEKVTCLGAGHRYWPQINLDESPDCGYRYQDMSPGEGASPYQITGEALWLVEWSGAGDSGQISTYTESTRDGYVGEIQVVNVS